MAYALPPNNLIASLFADTPAAAKRRRQLLEQDAKLKAADWNNTDPGNGPLRGPGGGGRVRAAAARSRR